LKTFCSIYCHSLIVAPAVDEEPLARRASTPSSAVASQPASDDENDDEEDDDRGHDITSAQSSADYGAGAAGYASSRMSSRRSSLRSVTAFDLEQMSRAESPGPEPTEDPLAEVKAGVPLSRKSSVASLMPEVVVTKVVKVEGERSAENVPGDTEALEEDESKLRAPGSRIWNLLPAPTPTRFVGKMHAVVSSRGASDAASAFSRKSSIVSDVIKEDDGSSTTSDGVNGKTTPRSVSPDVTRKNQTLPGTARAVGKMKGTLTRMGSIDDQRSAPSRRSAWRSAAQHSRDDDGRGGGRGGRMHHKKQPSRQQSQDQGRDDVKQTCTFDH